MNMDFESYWLAARYVLDGFSPYAARGFVSPVIFAYLMVPFALVRYDISIWLWGGLNVFTATALIRDKRLLLFVPVLFSLMVGQIDILVFVLGNYGGPLGLALTTIKPQIAIWFFILQWSAWLGRKEYHKILISLLVSFGLHLTMFLLQPHWLSTWLSSAESIIYITHSASLFGSYVIGGLPSVVILTSLVLCIFIFLRRYGFEDKEYWMWMTLFNPISNTYSLVVLIESIDVISVVLSMVAFILTVYNHTAFPFVLVSSYLLVKTYSKKKLFQSDLKYLQLNFSQILSMVKHEIKQRAV